MKDQPTSQRPRSSGIYALAALVVIAGGLASRRFPGLLPAFLGKYPGDALWALMVFCLLGVLLPRISTLRLAGLALAISYAVELSQLYHVPWLDSLRSTTLGHLVLGSAFSWGDLLAYAIGVALGAPAELILRSRPS